MVAVAVGTDVQPASARSIEETHLFSFENPRNQETVTCEILISNVFPYASDPERAFARTVVTGGPPECFELFDGLNETSVSITGRYRDTGVVTKSLATGTYSVATETWPDVFTRRSRPPCATAGPSTCSDRTRAASSPSPVG